MAADVRQGCGIPMIGSIIGEHMRILGRLGQGGMGDVYLGIDERLGRHVAVKAIRSDNDGARARFLREARALSSLDHPNICRIFEYVRTPDGEFLILELIDGVTLGRAIERGMSRPKKLRAAAEILEALAAAHRKGIVHYDIKPDNVMIASDGTAKVLDFGIVRLAGEDDRAEVEVRTPGEDETTLIYRIAGVGSSPHRGRPVIAGTPQYMSPEQAAGGEISTASDLYSFGLLLQMLLTEQPPHDPSLDRDALLERASRGESLPMAGQARDVSALVAALKQYEPSRRPTAPEALIAIGRIIDAPRRRGRSLAASALVALLLTGAAKYGFDITAARNEADLRRGQAEKLVRFMVGDLRQRLETVGRLDVLDGAASRSLAYFASLRPEEMTGQDLNDNALALAQLGQARDQQGKLDEAIELFRQSKRFALAAVSRDAAREEWQLTLSNAYFWLGDVLRREGNHRETLENFRAYFAIARGLAARHPSDARYQAEVSYAHGNLGGAWEAAGELSRAMNEYGIALQLDRERMRRDANNAQWQADVANSANRLGVVLQNTGDFNGARDTFDEDLRIRRRLMQAAPDDARRQRRLAVSLAYAGMLHLATGDPKRALDCLREEVALTNALANADPTNADAKRNRAVAQARLSAISEPSAAIPLAEAAASELHALVRADPRATRRRDLAVALTRASILRLRAGNIAAATSAVDEAVALSEALVVERPKDAICVRILCESLLAAAAVDERAGVTARAMERRTRAVTAALSVEHDPFVMAIRVRALVALGRISEAAPLAKDLLAGGYREAEFMAAAAELRPAPTNRSSP